MTEKQFDPIKEILERVVNNLDKGGAKEKGAILDFWPLMAGPKIAEHTKAYAIRNKKLYVRVDDSTWAYELSQKYKVTFLKRLQHEFGEEKIQDIRFRVGEI
ncbi:MAG: DUF721 domain-containing protein [Candidatus Omnitrophica bacterium]|nr:DUF721 domain-containing protein [Candidatus Omnitrophota bacterium]